MKRFRFKLEPVLKYRTALEQLRLQAFAAVQAELNACDERLARYRREQARILSAGPGRWSVDYFTNRERYIDAIKARIAGEERQREGIAARLEDARSALVEARRARESVERLRERAFENYVAETRLAEQNMLDELASPRHSRRAA
jgi:flagellar FliJ protein